LFLAFLLYAVDRDTFRNWKALTRGGADHFSNICMLLVSADLFLLLWSVFISVFSVYMFLVGLL